MRKDWEIAFHWNVENTCTPTCQHCLYHRPPKTGIIATLFKKHSGKAAAVNLLPAVDALLRTLSVTGRKCLVTLSGHEPLLLPDFIEICRRITNEHYLGVISSLTAPEAKIVEFADSIDHEKVYHITAPLHLNRLLQKNLLAQYSDNFALLRHKKFALAPVLIAHPGLLERVNYYKNYYGGREIYFDTKLFIGNYKGKQYPEAYTEDDLAKCGLRRTEVEEAVFRKGTLCNAGRNVFFINKHGEIRPCHAINKVLGTIHTGFTPVNKLKKCPAPRCRCPFPLEYKELYAQAIAQPR